VLITSASRAAVDRRQRPRIETLIDISRKTGLEFAIDIAPALAARPPASARLRDVSQESG
jgi:hypothetical protein